MTIFIYKFLNLPRILRFKACKSNESGRVYRAVKGITSHTDNVTITGADLDLELI